MPKNMFPSNRRNAEEKRLAEKRDIAVPPWQKWGPYLSERSWGTVREDYSSDGNAWQYFTFEDSHKRAYRWGEDGIAGFSDRYQILAIAPAFWNTKDPILKERLFGLSSWEGNHGEDVKECYYYLDALPSHAYMKYLYRYPQETFPYEKLREENRKRSSSDPEYELLDTGIFDSGAYFDIYVEYAKISEEDIAIKIHAVNEGPLPAPLHILMQLAFRNQWSWSDEKSSEPNIRKGNKGVCLIADDSDMPALQNLSFEYRLGKRYLYGESGGSLLFTNNDSKRADVKGFYKDAFHEAIVHKQESLNPEHIGTKAALHYVYESIEPKASKTLYFRFSPKPLKDPLKDLENIFEKRKKEADVFYKKIHGKRLDAEEENIQRQAIAGLLWNKQIYLFDVNTWLDGDSKKFPPSKERLHIRNTHWRHLNSMRILYVPDKWEYPWFASWDHAFHCITLALVDIVAAKEQLWLLLFDQFQHPNGQIPAYEWEFSDLNPPVQAWTALHLYKTEKEKTGKGDKVFLERCFHKLLMNFSWWVNKIDNQGKNVFEGGFLGLDNITLWDRSEKIPNGASLQQSDGTGWMALFCLNLMRIALHLAEDNPVYESLATKFFEHYIYIAHAMHRRQDVDYELWSERDGFFYDVLTYADRSFEKIRVRSVVGVIPLFCVDLFDETLLKKHPEFARNFHWFLKNRSNLAEHAVIEVKNKGKSTYLLSLLTPHRLKRVLQYVIDKEEFASDYGMRSLSKHYEQNPYYHMDRKISYEPAESQEKIKGGNSNWRGPIWIQVNYLLIESLKVYHDFYKEDYFVRTKEGEDLNLLQLATLFAERNLKIFKKNERGYPPYLGEHFPFAHKKEWVEPLLFYEYFNPETGKGLGASHQTGWTALIANLIQDFYK